MKTLTAKELAQLKEKKVDLKLVNVLDEEKFREQHIPGSQNVPLGREDFSSQMEQMTGSRDRPVVVYCASEECDASPKAARKLEEAGFTNVYDFEGGVKEWKAAGLRLEGSQAS